MHFLTSNPNWLGVCDTKNLWQPEQHPAYHTGATPPLASHQAQEQCPLAGVASAFLAATHSGTAAAPLGGAVAVAHPSQCGGAGGVGQCS